MDTSGSISEAGYLDLPEPSKHLLSLLRPQFEKGACLDPKFKFFVVKASSTSYSQPYALEQQIRHYTDQVIVPISQPVGLASSPFQPKYRLMANPRLNPSPFGIGWHGYSQNESETVYAPGRTDVIEKWKTLAKQAGTLLPLHLGLEPVLCFSSKPAIHYGGNDTLWAHFVFKALVHSGTNFVTLHECTESPLDRLVAEVLQNPEPSPSEQEESQRPPDAPYATTSVNIFEASITVIDLLVAGLCRVWPAERNPQDSQLGVCSTDGEANEDKHSDEQKSNFTVDNVTLSLIELKVLKFVSQSKSRLKNVEIEAEVGRSKTTVGAAVARLLELGFLDRPQGERSGVAITDQGRDFVRRSR